MASITETINETFKRKPKKQAKPKLFEICEYADFREMMESAAKEAGDIVAYRERIGRGELLVTYAGLQSTVRAVAAGLSSLGLRRSHIAAVGNGGYPMLVTMLAVLQSPGVYLPMDSDLPVDELLPLFRSGDAEAVFLEKSLVKTVRKKAERMRGVRYFICEGLPREEQDDRFLSFERLVETGRALLESGKADFLGEALPGDELRLIRFTESKKGIMLSQRNLMSAVRGRLQIVGSFATTLSVLPFHQCREIVANLLAAFWCRAEIVRLNDIGSLMTSFKTYRPDTTLLAPIQLETLYGNIWRIFESQGKGDMLRQMLRTGNQLRKAGIDRRRTFFSAIHDSFGGNMKCFLCVGTPLRKTVAEFFDNIGIPVLSGYSLPECASVVSICNEKTAGTASAGYLLPGLEGKIDSPDENGSGEVLLRGEGLMLGYYNQPKRSREVIDAEGWFHSGDIGSVNDKGLLTITGSLTNLIHLKNGQTVIPEEIENYLLQTPYIDSSKVYAVPAEEGEEITLAAELYLRPEAVLGLSAGDQLKLMKREIDDINAGLPAYKQVKTVRIRRTPFPKA